MPRSAFAGRAGCGAIARLLHPSARQSWLDCCKASEALTQPCGWRGAPRHPSNNAWLGTAQVARKAPRKCHRQGARALGKEHAASAISGTTVQRGGSVRTRLAVVALHGWLFPCRSSRLRPGASDAQQTERTAHGLGTLLTQARLYSRPPRSSGVAFNDRRCGGCVQGRAGFEEATGIGLDGCSCQSQSDDARHTTGPPRRGWTAQDPPAPRCFIPARLALAPPPVVEVAPLSSTRNISRMTPELQPARGRQW